MIDIIIRICYHPVGWGCRIHPLHFWTGVRPSPMGPSVGRGWRRHWFGDRVINDLQHTILALTWSDGRSDCPDPINHTPAHICLFSLKYIIQSSLAEQCPTLYLIGTRRQGLRVKYVLKKWFFDPVRLSYKNQNLAEAQNIALNMSILVLHARISQGEWVSLLVNSLLKLDSWWVVEHRTSKKHITDIASFSKKKFKRNLNKLDSSDNETSTFSQDALSLNLTVLQLHIYHPS